MAHQVFLSHATEDRDTASRLCSLLEADGIGCWFASRDADAGKDQAAATLDAIRGSDLVLLVFSASANASPYVLREIERAIAYERPVLSIHLDDAVPNPSMEYYLNLWQWLEVRGSVENQRAGILGAVREQLALAPDPTESPELGSVAASEAGEQAEPGGRTASGNAHRLSRRTWVIALAAVLLIAAAGLGLGLRLTESHNLWTKLAQEGTRPPARLGHSMVYDSSNGLVVVFGGTGDNVAFNDTWTYDPSANTWTARNPSGTLPAARYNHTMAYDPATDRVIMFGGAFTPSGSPGSTDTVLSDTWAYNPAINAWTNLDPAGTLPSPRAQQSMVYDPSSGRVIMFGGYSTDPDGNNGVDVNDTWAYDPTKNTWTNLQPSGTLPSPREQQSMVYDSSSRVVIMFGGRSGMGGSFDFNDTWAYDPATNTWTELSPSGTLPSARVAPSMAYDSSAGRLIMFGGAAGSSIFDDTWAYDSRRNSWTELSTSGTGPFARVSSSMVYDPSTNRTIMFGGGSKRGTRADTWACTP